RTLAEARMGSDQKDLPAVSADVLHAAESMVDKPAVAGGKSKGGIDCFALIDKILKESGAQSAADFGTVTPDADYAWGEQIALAQLQPGDVLQFHKHVVTIRTLTMGDNAQWKESEERVLNRPHHSAIVAEVLPDQGGVAVIEQNVKPDPKKIHRNVIPLLAGD